MSQVPTPGSVVGDEALRLPSGKSVACVHAGGAAQGIYNAAKILQYPIIFSVLMNVQHDRRVRDIL